MALHARHRGRFAILFAGLLLAVSPAVAASVLESVEFQQMEAQGFSHETALVFAAFAESRKDPDAAIAALEHSLLQNGDNPELHGRLAELYQRVGNADLTRYHAERAAVSTDVETPQIWGRVGVGAAYDTNPTAAENSAEVRIFDAASNAFVNVAAREAEPDTLATVSLELNADHRLSDTALLAAELSVNAEKYFDSETLDNVTGAFTIGPWLGPGETESGPVWLRPFASFAAATLDGQPYYFSYGGGAELRFALGEADQASLTAAVRQTDYNGRISPNFDANTLDHLGLSLSAGMFGQGPFDSTYSVLISGEVTNASRSSESYILVGAEAGVGIPITAFGRVTGVPLSLQLGASVNSFAYADPDPGIDPTQARRDLWYGVDGSLLLTVTKDVDLTFGVDYVRQTSNIDAFDTDNLRIFTELGLSF